MFQNSKQDLYWIVSVHWTELYYTKLYIFKFYYTFFL